MLFNSLHFYIFCIVLVPIFFLANQKNQKWILLAGSFYFYSCLKIAFVPLILFSFMITFFGTIYMQKNENWRKFWLAFVVLINIGILILFKYSDFIRSIYFESKGLFGFDSEYSKIGFILPLGISFYTFQAIAYTVDVYRKKLEAEKSFSDFSLFLIFFPQLVAGPIMRASVLIPQFSSLKRWDLKNFSNGMGQIALGIFKKTMIADQIPKYIDPIYLNPSEYHFLSLFVAVFFFAVEIYCDFAGYSDIAIGIGKIMGFEIPMNFNRPFFAASSSELWRRWHISLSTWLRDYIYISLGGNKVSIFRNYINLFLTMLAGGIWHGANWTFVIWGAICGVSVSVEKFFIDNGYEKYFINIPRPLKVIYTFLIFMLGALFFKSENFYSAKIMLTRILGFEDGKLFFISSLFLPTFILFLIELSEELKIAEDLKNSEIYKWIRPLLISSILIIAGFEYTITTSPQFYYFQF
jgi:alginate O-acetyltransferase complex protein AlgI